MLNSYSNQCEIHQEAEHAAPVALHLRKIFTNRHDQILCTFFLWTSEFLHHQTAMLTATVHRSDNARRAGVTESETMNREEIQGGTRNKHPSRLGSLAPSCGAPPTISISSRLPKNRRHSHDESYHTWVRNISLGNFFMVSH